jgi:FKBP-type peptidyl-prolyl cis-trans isomerase
MKYVIFIIIIAAAAYGVSYWLKTTPIEPAPKIGAPAPKVQEEQPKQSDTMNIQTVQEGTGPEIKAGQTAVVEYTGKLDDGSVFDATSKHGGKPFEFELGSGMVIKGWDQGVLGMKVGETRILTIPSELGYGPSGYPPIIPPNATLTFEVKLVAIK